MFAGIFRRFAFKPSSKIEFINKRALIITNEKAVSYNKGITTVATLVPGAFLYRIYDKWLILGNLNFFLSNVLLLATLSLTRTWFNLQRQMTYQVYLCEDGKHIEIHNLRLFNNIDIIKISDIENPETSPIAQVQMKFSSTYLILTKQGKLYYLMPESVSFYPEVLKEIIKGNEIEIDHGLKDSEGDDDDFIDV